MWNASESLPRQKPKPPDSEGVPSEIQFLTSKTEQLAANKSGESGDVDRLAVRPYTVKALGCQEKVAHQKYVKSTPVTQLTLALKSL